MEKLTSYKLNLSQSVARIELKRSTPDKQKRERDPTSIPRPGMGDLRKRDNEAGRRGIRKIAPLLHVRMEGKSRVGSNGHG